MRQEKKTTEKSRKMAGVWILAGVLLILVAVYFGLQAWNKSQEEKENQKTEASKVHVTETSATDIVSMKFDVGNGQMEFVKESGKWYAPSDRDFPLDQSYPENIAETIGSITASRELEEGDALEDYGLETPVYTVEYADSKGDATKIYFGNMTGDSYYVTVGDKKTVYTVDSYVIEPMRYNLEDMAQLDDYPSIGSGNLVKEIITQNGQTTTYDSENEDQQEDIAAIAGGLGAVTLSEAADYSVEDKDLAGYSLDEASRTTVEVTYTQDDEEKTLTLYFGGQDGNGNRYMMMEDSRIVYLIPEETCNNILNV